MPSYLPYEPQQQMLLPEALQDWLPEGHLAYFISDAVDGLDLSAFPSGTPQVGRATSRSTRALGPEDKEQLHAQAGPRTVEMAAKLRTDAGKQAYRRRKWIAEPPNGWIKNVLGFRQFSMRGLHRVKAEWKLVCMALNLRRMCALRAA